MEHANTGTPTDPIWWFVVLAGLFVLSAITLFVVLDSILRAVIRRAQQARAQRHWDRDVAALQEARIRGGA